MRLDFRAEAQSECAQRWGGEKPTAAIAAVLSVLPERFRREAERLVNGPSPIGRLEELRFRTGRPAQFIGSAGEAMLTGLLPLGEEEAKAMLAAVCDHSVYARERELAHGFVTLGGGARVGLGGSPLASEGAVERLTAVSCFNFRIPREVRGCAEKHAALFLENEKPRSALIAAPPGVGKTTFLRDLARCLSTGSEARRALKVCIADERNELCACVRGVPTLDVGPRTDVISGIAKSLAMPMLIRSLSPQVIITDELGGELSRDMCALNEAAGCGVAVIAGIHAASYADLIEKQLLRPALEEGRLKAFILKRSGGIFELLEAKSEKPFEENGRERWESSSFEGGARAP